MITALLLAAQGIPAGAAPPPQPATCDQPVYMVVSGLTHDRTRMMVYAKAIADSGLYQELGGYYINSPRASATFEGNPEPSYTTLIVRFPCVDNARKFWNSRVYQKQIKPLRLEPSAGDYTVQVFPEVPLREDMEGKVGEQNYRADFGSADIEQVDTP